MKPVVDHAEFDAIACNRCEGFTLDWNPAETLEQCRQFNTHYPDMTHAETLDDLDTIVDMLLPRADHQEWQDAHAALWTCRHFSRDAQGLGVCGIYDTRPRMCSRFPYGQPNRMYAECSFNVRRVRKHLPVIAH